MSIWSDIHKRSNGKTVSKEDELEIYSGEFSQIGSGEYNQYRYEIWTGGTHPFIAIIPNLITTNLSDVYSVECIMPDGKSYDLARSNRVDACIFYHHFNKYTDYILGDYGHDGKKYTLNELQDLAKEFIKHLITCECDLIYKYDDADI